MAKTETRWVCQECGWSFIKEMGRCPHCSAWDSLKKTVVRDELPATSLTGRVGSGESLPTPLSQVDLAGHARIPVANAEFARVLGGGLVPGSIILIGGEPGIGKSTLLLQIAAILGDAQHPVLYVSGEESPGQLKRRAARLGITGDTIQVLAETNVDFVLQQADRLLTLQALIVDSIQTTHTGDLDSAAGNVSQVRECA
ncbi:MAG TPA: AAA family ATPase, partial [Thermoflexia bacterium]|nr:AAA family ATPase [Thermoflexia bacterium]